MQFIVARENLLKPLQQVCGVLGSRPNIPVLNNLLLHIEGDLLTLTGTDLEVELSTQAPLLSSGQGKFTIPAKKFLDICRSLPDDAEITVSFEEDRAIVRSGRSKFNLATLPAEEYPNLTDWQSEVDFSIQQTTLRRLIEATQFSMANQDARYLKPKEICYAPSQRTGIAWQFVPLLWSRNYKPIRSFCHAKAY